MSMTAAHPADPDVLRHVFRLQILTVIWMTTEAIVALAAAWAAGSPTLLGFGRHSTVELLSAIIVLWRFRSKSDAAQDERIAAPTTGALLFVVAALLVAASSLALAGTANLDRAWSGSFF